MNNVADGGEAETDPLRENRTRQLLQPLPLLLVVQKKKIHESNEESDSDRGLKANSDEVD